MTSDQEAKLYQMRKFAIMDLEHAEDTGNEVLIEIAVAKYNTLYEVFYSLGLEW